MAYFLHAAVCVGLLLLSACGKTDTSTAGSATPMQAATTSATLPLPAVVVPQPRVQAKTYDGPFGLAMGIHAQEIIDGLGFQQSKLDNVYVGIPPKLVPGIDAYLVTATPAEGLCKILGLQEVVNVSASGDQLKAAADTLAEMVELKYGKPMKKYDLASQDIYRDKPEYWMLALKKSEVTYAYRWVNGKSLNLPNNIKEIEISVIGDCLGSGLSSGCVRLRYSFSNEKACDDEAKRKKSSNL